MVSLSSAAADKVRELLGDKPENTGLRLFIRPGGCSGFSYGMAIDKKQESDSVMNLHGIDVYVDSDSARYVEGAEIDYVDSLSGTGFTIHNPNAVSTCGCGSSFRTKDEAGVPGSCS